MASAASPALARRLRGLVRCLARVALVPRSLVSGELLVGLRRRRGSVGGRDLPIGVVVFARCIDGLRVCRRYWIQSYSCVNAGWLAGLGGLLLSAPFLSRRAVPGLKGGL